MFNEIVGGNRLFNTPPNLCFYKKRIPDSSGFRLYSLADYEKERVFCSFIHPKSGKVGLENINDDFKKSVYKESLELRKGQYKGLCFEITVVGEELLFSEFYQNIFELEFVIKDKK